MGFTLVLAFSPIGLWVATLGLYRAGERQIRIAAKSADIAEQALVKLERAFIHPKDMFYRWHWVTNSEPKVYFWRIRPIYENTGNSATVDLVTNINSVLLDHLLPETFPFTMAPESFNAFIGPKSTILGETIDIGATDLLAIKEGHKHFYFWGVLRYNDIFDGSYGHITTFCREVTHVTGNPLNPSDEANPVTLFFSMTDRHNTAD